MKHLLLIACLSLFTSQTFAEQFECASKLFGISYAEQVEKIENDIARLSAQLSHSPLPDFEEFRKEDPRYEWMTESELSRVFRVRQRKEVNVLIHSLFKVRAVLFAAQLGATEDFQEELRRIQYHFHPEYTDLPADYRPRNALTYELAEKYKRLFDEGKTTTGKDGLTTALPGNLTSEQMQAWRVQLKEYGFEDLQPWHTIQMIVKGTPIPPADRLGFRQRCCLGACTQCPWSTEEFAVAKERRARGIKPSL